MKLRYGSAFILTFLGVSWAEFASCGAGSLAEEIRQIQSEDLYVGFDVADTPEKEKRFKEIGKRLKSAELEVRNPSAVHFITQIQNPEWRPEKKHEPVWVRRTINAETSPLVHYSPGFLAFVMFNEAAKEENEKRIYGVAFIYPDGRFGMKEVPLSDLAPR